MTDNIKKFPLQPKGKRTIEIVRPPYTSCQHTRALIDEKLAELECADCGAKISPMAFLMTLANKATMWQYEANAIAKARAEIDERKRCRCTRCGEWTEIRRVHNREAARIKRNAEGKSDG